MNQERPSGDTYRVTWRITRTMSAFITRTPEGWEAPTGEELRSSGLLERLERTDAVTVESESREILAVDAVTTQAVSP